MNSVFYPDLDERVYRERLENGLTVLVAPRKGFSRRLAYFVTDFGAIHTDNRRGKGGSSDRFHFLGL